MGECKDSDDGVSTRSELSCGQCQQPLDRGAQLGMLGRSSLCTSCARRLHVRQLLAELPSPTLYLDSQERLEVVFKWDCKLADVDQRLLGHLYRRGVVHSGDVTPHEYERLQRMRRRLD